MPRAKPSLLALVALVPVLAAGPVQAGSEPGSGKPNGARTRSLTENHVSLRRHFAANGYKTLTTGKIYHASQVQAKEGGQ